MLHCQPNVRGAAVSAASLRARQDAVKALRAASITSACPAFLTKITTVSS